MANIGCTFYCYITRD